MKVIITGGCGFIGSNAVKYFKDRGYEIIVIDKCTYAAKPELIKSWKIPLYKLDIVSNNWNYIFDMHKPDAVINFAAESHVDNSILDAGEFIHSNYLGVHEILKAIRHYRDKDISLIHVGTDEEYGDMEINSTKKFKETSPLRPNNPYSASKAAASLLLRASFHTYKDFRCAICRATNNYGPYQHKEKFIPTVVRSAYRDAKIPIYGKGLNVREWLFVEDFVRGIELTLHYINNANGCTLEEFNFGSDNSVNNITLAKKILRILDRTEKLISFVEDRKGHDRKYSVDWSKAKKVLDWCPKKNFEKGLRKTVYEILKVSM